MTPEGKVAEAIRKRLLKLQKSGEQLWFVKIAGGHRQRRGLPDTAIVYRGRAVWIEAKSPGKEPTPLQLDTLEKIRRAGGIAECIDDAAELDWVLLMAREANDG